MVLFEKVVHGRPMLSLSNVFSADEVRAFDQRVTKELGTSNKGLGGGVEN